SDGASSFNLTKELTGTLVLDQANTYDGQTFVLQGALRVENPTALGSAAGDTEVSTGAQLQIEGNFTVPAEPLLLSGTGIFDTGALLNTGGNNGWQGPITMTVLPVDPTQAKLVSFGVANAGDSLTLDTTVGESGGSFEFDKVGPGKVVLTKANLYTGVTDVL